MFFAVLLMFLQSAPGLVPTIQAPGPSPTPTIQLPAPLNKTKTSDAVAMPLTTQKWPAEVPSTFKKDSGGTLVLPADTETSIWCDLCWGLLPREQIKPYFEGLVRSGLEDLGMCKPGYTCHASGRFQKWTRESDQSLVVQMRFDTRTTYNELLYFYDRSSDPRETAWLLTSSGWKFLGVLSEVRVARTSGSPVPEAAAINLKAKRIIDKLKTCSNGWF